MISNLEIEEIEKLISKGETEKALEKTKDYLKDKDKGLYRECLVLSNKYYESKNDYLLNLVEKRESSSKIVLGLLYIIKRMEHENQSLNNRIANKISKINNSLYSSKEDTASKYVLASKTERFLAFFIEQLIFLSIAFILLLLLGGDLKEFLEEPVSIGSIFTNAIFSGILGLIFYPLWSGNLGHKIMGLKVINAGSNENYDKRLEGFIREFLKSLMVNLIIPMIWLFFDDKRQNVYDKIINTIVVKK